jgi:uncharacterized membrane protein HdeD (DUF308 family)
MAQSAQERNAMITTTNESEMDYGRLLSGLTLITIGSLFWLDEIGRLEVRNLWEFWPLILVAHGLAKILSRDACGNKGGGWLLLALGGLFFFDVTLDTLDIDQTWPLLLLVGGVASVWQALRHRSRNSGIGDAELKERN